MPFPQQMLRRISFVEMALFEHSPGAEWRPTRAYPEYLPQRPTPRYSIGALTLMGMLDLSDSVEWASSPATK